MWLWFGDLVIFIVDYGNDLIWFGIDYICECVFVLGWGYGVWVIG